MTAPPVQVCHNDVPLPLYSSRIPCRRQLLLEAVHAPLCFLQGLFHCTTQLLVQAPIHLTSLKAEVVLIQQTMH
jgi:hypothetical protein